MQIKIHYKQIKFICVEVLSVLTLQLLTAKPVIGFCKILRDSWRNRFCGQVVVGIWYQLIQRCLNRPTTSQCTVHVHCITLQKFIKLTLLFVHSCTDEVVLFAANQYYVNSTSVVRIFRNVCKEKTH